jgi:hypothetical protein
MSKIKFQVEREDGFSFRFFISEKGELVIEAQNQKIEIDHVTSVELIEILRHRLYEHQAKSSSLLKRIFQ